MATTGRRTRILSFDPGLVRPGVALVEVWWEPGSREAWPRVIPLVLLGETTIPTGKSLTNMSISDGIAAFAAYLHTHAATLFRHRLDYILVETQRNTAFTRKTIELSRAMFALLAFAQQDLGIHGHPVVRMVPPGWKTQGLGVPAGAGFYNQRKAASVAQTTCLLRREGMVQTVARLQRHRAKRDVSDAFMQAVQFFMHLPAGKREAKARDPIHPLYNDDRSDGGDSNTKSSRRGGDGGDSDKVCTSTNTALALVT